MKTSEIKHLYKDIPLKDRKLILRNISDVSEMELIKILNTIYTSIFGYHADIKNVEIIREHNSIGLICVDRIDEKRLGLTIEMNRGIEFSNDSKKLIFNPFIITKDLLKMGIDIFGLIDSGEAIQYP